MGKSTDFRYNTGATRVPWAAVGENYNVHDLMEIIKFLMQGEGKEYDDALEDVWQQVKKLDALATPPGKLSLGSKVEAAEAACNEYLGTTSSTFVTNATAGFEIAYKYANLKPGDEVIVPAITFVATMAYPLAIGAKLVFADVDPKTINMDPADVARKITDKTKMIVPVHIGGYPVDMDPIMKLAKEHDILVLEDAAHAFGAMYKGKKIGTIGDFAAFSMHEVKNITSFGEGGIATTNIPGFESEMKRARFLGLDFSCPIKDWLYNITPIQGKYEPFVAGNSSTTEIQGLGLSLQVSRNEEIIADGMLGEIVSARAQFTCWYPEMENCWRQNRKLSGGGAMLDMAIHSIDLIRYITGLEVAEAAGFTGNQIFNYNVDDAGIGVYKMENGALCVVESAFNIPDDISVSKLEIYGTKGCIIAKGTLSQEEGGEIEVLTIEDAGEYDAQQNRSTVAPVPVCVTFGNMYTKEIEAFGKAVLGDAKIPVTAEDAIRSQKAI